MMVWIGNILGMVKTDNESENNNPNRAYIHKVSVPIINPTFLPLYIIIPEINLNMEKSTQDAKKIVAINDRMKNIRNSTSPRAQSEQSMSFNVSLKRKMNNKADNTKPGRDIKNVIKL